MTKTKYDMTLLWCHGQFFNASGQAGNDGLRHVHRRASMSACFTPKVDAKRDARAAILRSGSGAGAIFDAAEHLPRATQHRMSKRFP